ncbi:hypothetical protein P3T37_006081 [Kitasatospora sp. MAA4]|nr:hypothetical protein [Kitasatospora sp. MAA4]
MTEKRQPSVAVSPDELLLPARARRPEDLVRFALGAVLIGLTLLAADAAQSTAGGLNADAARGAGRAPQVLLSVAGSFSTVAVLLVPVAFVGQQILRRDVRRIAAGVLAAVLAYGTSLLVDLWAIHLAPHAVLAALTGPVPGGTGSTEPVLSYLAAVLACMTAAGVAQQPRWAAALAVLLGLNALTVLVGGSVGVLSLLLALLIGWTLAHGATYALGSPNARPTAADLFVGLGQLEFSPVTALRTPGTGAHEPHHYLVGQADGRPDLDVVVLGRESSGFGFLRRAWQRVRLRTAPQRRSLLSLRGVLKQESLLCYAVQEAGARSRRLLAVAELGPDAALIIYEPLSGHTLDQLHDAEVTDALLRDTWRQVKLLQSRRIVHRNLVASALLMDDRGAVHLVGLEDGDVAARDLALRTDVAQLLTTLGLRVGPERAVAGAFAVLGPDRVGAVVPLLQPLALSRETRAALKRHDGSGPSDPAGAAPDLLAQLREEILRTRPQAPVEPARLERLRPRTLVTVLGGATAGYFVLLQLRQLRHQAAARPPSRPRPRLRPPDPHHRGAATPGRPGQGGHRAGHRDRPGPVVRLRLHRGLHACRQQRLRH